MSAERSSSTIDPELLDLLRCPLTGSRLRPEGDFLVAEVGGLAYPVRDGFPVMLIEEARLPAGVESLAVLKARVPPRDAMAEGPRSPPPPPASTTAPPATPPATTRGRCAAPSGP